MYIIIPTYKRVDKQITIKSIPEKYHNMIYAVVQPQEYEAYVDNNPGIHTVILPNDVKGITRTRQWISQFMKGKRHMVLDDDLSFRTLTKVGDKVEYVELTEARWDKMFQNIAKFCDLGYVHGALAPEGFMPKEEEFSYNSRPCQAHWYSEDYPHDQIDFIGPEHLTMYPEDFYVAIQAIELGYDNVIFEWFRCSGSPTQSAGGCSDFRTLETHNEGTRWLADRYPDYVKTRVKVQKSGPWKDMEKLAMTIQWKKIARMRDSGE